MEKIKDFDVRQFAPESSATRTNAAGGDIRPSKRNVSSGHSEFTERNEVAGQTMPTPQSEIIEETAQTETSEQTRPIGEIAPIPSSGQVEKPRQTVSTSVSDQSVSSRQTVPAQSSEPIQQIEQTQPTPAQPSRVSSRQRRASLDEYKEMFLSISKITDRQPVFVSRDVRDKIDGVVRRLGERKMSVSGFLENLARHHLDLYADDLEQWKRL